MNQEKPKRTPQEYINVSVPRNNYFRIKEFLEKHFEGASIAKFYDNGAMDRMFRIEKRNTPFDLISTDTFLKAGWEKIGSSTYRRGDSIAMYTGTFWYCDGVQLTKDNWYEKIGDKTKLK